MRFTVVFPVIVERVVHMHCRIIEGVVVYDDGGVVVEIDYDDGGGLVLVRGGHGGCCVRSSVARVRFNESNWLVERT
jgi:hypothetical protein